jgi:DNA-binding PadR family transcriptional regulator
MPPLTLYLLLALADQDLGSAELLRRAQDDTHNDVWLRPRSMYVALDRLVRTKHITRRLDSYGRVTYHLTRAGVQSLKFEQARIERVARLLSKRLS